MNDWEKWRESVRDILACSRHDDDDDDDDDIYIYICVYIYIYIYNAQLSDIIEYSYSITVEG